MNKIDFSELPHRGKYVDWKNVKSNTIILFWEEKEYQILADYLFTKNHTSYIHLRYEGVEKIMSRNEINPFRLYLLVFNKIRTYDVWNISNSLYDISFVRNNYKNPSYLKNISKYSYEEIEITCPYCKKTYIIKAKEINDGENKCPVCTKGTFPERVMRSLLKNNNIYFEEQVYVSSINKIFDFYLKNHNIVIETHGLQHYKDINFMNHKKTVKSDQMKRIYCQENNIQLIEINCSKSDVHFIIEEIKKSQLSNILTDLNEENIRIYNNDYYDYVLNLHSTKHTIYEISLRTGFKRAFISKITKNYNGDFFTPSKDDKIIRGIENLKIRDGNINKELLSKKYKDREKVLNFLKSC